MITQKMVDAVAAEILERCQYAHALIFNALDMSTQETAAVMQKTDGENGPDITLTIYKPEQPGIFEVLQVSLRETNDLTQEPIYRETVGIPFSQSANSMTHTIHMALAASGYFQRLPEGYKRCEYLESYGQQYIDTGYAYRDADFEIECKYRKTTALNTCIFGVDSGSRPRNMHGHIYNQAAYLGNSSRITGITQNLDTDYSVKVSYSAENGVFSVSMNGDTMTKTGDNGWAGTEWTDYLYAANKNGRPDYIMAGRIYYHRMKDKTGTVRDYVPCLDEKGKPCMFDLVGRKAYYNLGSGEFGYKEVGYSFSEMLRQNVLTAIYNSCQHIYAKELLPDGNARFREMLLNKKVEIADGKVRVLFTFDGASNGTIKAFYLIPQGQAAANAVFAEDVDIALSAAGDGGPCAVYIDFGS